MWPIPARLWGRPCQHRPESGQRRADLTDRGQLFDCRLTRLGLFRGDGVRAFGNYVRVGRVFGTSAVVRSRACRREFLRARARGHVKLTDMGLAKASRACASAGRGRGLPSSCEEGGRACGSLERRVVFWDACWRARAPFHCSVPLGASWCEG